MGAKNFGGRSGGRRGRLARAGGAAGRAGEVRFKARTSAVFFLVSELILDHILINFYILGSNFYYFSHGGLRVASSRVAYRCKPNCATTYGTRQAQIC